MSSPSKYGVGKREPKTKTSNLAGYEAARTAASKGMSALDQLELEDQGDVYDMMDDDEYEKLVEKRRAEQEFVVDDGKSRDHGGQLFSNPALSHLATPPLTNPLQYRGQRLR